MENEPIKNDDIVSSLLNPVIPLSGDVNLPDTSSNFYERDRLFMSLGMEYTSEAKKFKTTIHNPNEAFNLINEGVFLTTWQNYENISARLIEIYDNTVVLECLIDKEDEIYEEREFRLSLFKDYNLTIGNLFYLRFFERPNESRIEVHKGDGLVPESDFPKTSFKDIFKTSKLFKK